MVKKKIKVLVNKTLSSKIQKNDILLVSYGYARNYLLPKKFASIATQHIVEKSYKANEKQEQENLQQYKKQLNVKKFLEHIYHISFMCNIKQDYRFSGSISTAQVIIGIHNSTDITIKKTQLGLPNIRKIGLYRINIRFSPTVTVSIQLRVLPIIL